MGSKLIVREGLLTERWEECWREIDAADCEHLLQMQQELLTHRGRVAGHRNKLDAELGALRSIWEQVDTECRCADSLLDRVLDALRKRTEKEFGSQEER